MCDPARGSARAVTLIELMVVVAVIATLAALLLPALGGARYAARLAQGGSNLKQLAVATRQHMDDHDDRLPQMRLAPDGSVSDGPNSIHFNWLFGGARARMDVYGSTSIGADRRPLNAYLGDYGADARPAVFLDPLDDGTDDPNLEPFAPTGADPAVYDLLGTSYILNDHALDEVPCPFVEIANTLIPRGGGPAPYIESPSRTWLVGQSPIYNYDDRLDKNERWHRGEARASLAFADGHVELALPVPPGPINTTGDYTFLPTRDWTDNFPWFAREDH